MNPISEPETSRWSVALIISICVNLLLAGIIVMAVFRFAFHPPKPEPHPAGPFQASAPANPPMGQLERQQVRQLMSPRLLIRIAPDKAQAIRALMKSHHPEMDALRNASIAARREVVEAYTANDFERGKIEKALAKMQAADAALELAAIRASVESSVILTPEQRKAVIDSQPPHGGGHGPGCGGPNPPPGNGPNRLYDQPPVPVSH